MEKIIGGLPGTCMGTPFRYLADWVFESMILPNIAQADLILGTQIMFYVSAAGFFGAQTGLILKGVQQLADVPLTLVAIPFFFFAFFDWVVIESIV